MSDSEAFSLVVRVMALFGIGCLLALFGWWGMQGPELGVAAVGVAIFASLLADVARYVR